MPLTQGTDGGAFAGPGLLGLAQSHLYGGTIYGFSTNGTDSLDLGDIRFTDETEATFSGSAAGGVLTVEDGTYTAHISLRGNYTGVTFMAQADGQGGTLVTDAHAARNALHAFAAAMAGHTRGSAATIATPGAMAPSLFIVASSR
jgi:hypothetical protein